MNMLKQLLRWLLTRFYDVKVQGLEHYAQAGDRVLIIANHTSFLDAALLAAFLPDRLTFAVNTYVARAWWARPFLSLVEFFPMDPANALSTRSFIKHLKMNRKAVVFPEGRITLTGSLMKIYQGPGLVADRSGAMVLPVRIEGAQYTAFSRLRGRVRLRWFPTITLTLLPPRYLHLPNGLRGRARRNHAGRELADIMTEMMFATSNYNRTLFDALLDARRIHGGRHIIAEDIERKPITYDRLMIKAFQLGYVLAKDSERGENVGVLLPNMVSTIIALFALQLYGRVPAVLNFSAGSHAVLSAIETAGIRTVYTSRRFIHVARLEPLVERVADSCRLVFLEDVAASITVGEKFAGWLRASFPQASYRRLNETRDPASAAVVLFTSGSEGIPKGVVLSHSNLLANRDQVAARIDFSRQDIILNAVPLFHSFGFTAGTLLPLFSGLKTYFYPSPLHYRIIPEVCYDINATVLFGTNTFLMGYARFAHPYDFYSVRYVFSGAEKLQDETRRIWAEKFGIRVFEGYGTTETSPVLATNTAMDHRIGTVGRLLPGIDYRLDPVPGLRRGGRLSVKGPNVMLGYMRRGNPGQRLPLSTAQGTDWYDTGDIVSIDEDGFVTLLGRAKRFAKVGGEMVSLAAVELLVARTWPDAQHAVVTVSDQYDGERIVLVTEYMNATRSALLAQAKEEGITQLAVPRKIIIESKVPLLGSGKIDYKAVRFLAANKNVVLIDAG